MDRSTRRAAAERYKARSARDYRNRIGDDPRNLSTTRHALDCGRSRCGCCGGERYGKRDRVAAKRELVLA